LNLKLGDRSSAEKVGVDRYQAYRCSETGKCRPEFAIPDGTSLLAAQTLHQGGTNVNMKDYMQFNVRYLQVGNSLCQVCILLPTRLLSQCPDV